MGTENLVEIFDEAVYISHIVNTLGKDMNQTIFFPARDK